MSSYAKAFFLRAMLQFEHLDALFQELRVEGGKWSYPIVPLHHIHKLVWMPCPICALLHETGRHHFLA